jgi:hypothetical protein
MAHYDYWAEPVRERSHRVTAHVADLLPKERGKEAANWSELVFFRRDAESLKTQTPRVTRGSRAQ